jgi:hypothetical protein
MLAVHTALVEEKHDKKVLVDAVLKVRKVMLWPQTWATCLAHLSRVHASCDEYYPHVKCVLGLLACTPKLPLG